ncbi:MerR family transcriptional regulator [Bacillus sp. 2CMS4F]|uniref:MerR family transcriptional regulator n=1 Tax=Bacillus sp. 2CMS4F TaxID=2929170 RepID=UPI0020BFC837|nr:MerR family transcriptional regulator [Bacillus sp. 2CMS4F]MCK8098738.1 MerR family transcriptional regulator [Bacillus sp. 2CMS4F]
MEKLYTIQQISNMTKLSVHTLRYYEKIGLLREVRRDKNGYRKYAESDMSWINFLIRLRTTGMSITDMIRFSDLRSQGESTVNKRLELLETHQKNVLEEIEGLRDNLTKIEEKIDYYKSLEETK